MTFNDLCNRIHLPSLVGFYGLGSQYSFYKIPGFGWYGRDRSADRYFNFMELYRMQFSSAKRMSAEELIAAAYTWHTQEHPELFETPTAYSESSLNRLVGDYGGYHTSMLALRYARDEALHGTIRYNDRVHKFTRLLEEFNQTELIKSGVGILTPRVITELKSKGIRVHEKHINKMVIPSYFSPDGRIATLELCPLRDIGQRERLYTNREIGWYGRIGETLVGNVSDLLTIPGCTWDRKLGYWNIDKPVKLHHSLQPAQCLDIWLHSNGMPTDKNPLEVLRENKKLDMVRDHLGSLTLSQLRELEKFTAQPLYRGWIAQRNEELLVSGMRFSCQGGRYYFQRGTNWHEFTNFSVNLSHLKKEEGEWYQYGTILMNDQEVPLRAKRKDFVGHHALIQTLTETLLEAGVGVPTIAPNLRHYLVNVIDAFNAENRVEKPTPAPAEEPGENVPVRNIEPSL